MTERYRGIIIKDDKIAIMKRTKRGKRFYVFPGGGLEENETPEQCCKREVLEEFGINVEPQYMIYEITQKNTKQGFFVCKWIDGKIHKTDAEEYTDINLEKYGSYEPVLIQLSKFKNYNVFPTEVKEQLLNDLKEYGNELERPLIKFKCEYK